jgi:hypothetical protein
MSAWKCSSVSRSTAAQSGSPPAPADAADAGDADAGWLSSCLSDDEHEIAAAATIAAVIQRAIRGNFSGIAIVIPASRFIQSSFPR